MMVEFFTRGLTVLLGVGIVLFLPRAMFWPRRRQPYALLLFLMVEILTVSVVFAAIYAHAKGLPVVWFGAPLRAVALALGWAYLWRARKDWQHGHDE